MRYMPHIWSDLYNWFPSGNEIFFHESRRSKNLTAGIYMIFRGLNSESNEESGEKSRFRTETNWILLISALCCLYILSSCSALLITAGVLDAPEKHRIFTAQTRKEFEALTGPPIESRISDTGNKVDLYEYVDGEAPVIGTRGGGSSMSGGGDRGARVVIAVIFGGLYEIVMVPVAINERSRATRKIHVIYSPEDNLLVICPNRFSGKRQV